MAAVLSKLLVALALCVAAGLVAAPAITVRHESWPASCPARTAVADRAHEHLRGWSGEAATDARVVTHVRVLDERWMIDIEVEVEDGVTRRAFEASSCTDAVDVMALIVATAINPGGEGVEPEPIVPPPLDPGPATEEEATLQNPTQGPAPPRLPTTVQPDNSPEAPPASEPTSTVPSLELPPSAETPQARDKLRLVGSVHAGIAFGLLPLVGADVGGFIGARRNRLELGGTAGVATPRTLLEDGVGGRFTLWRGGVRACGRTTRRLSVGGCGALELGGTTARGVEFDQNERRTSLWSGAVASAWLGYHLGITSVRFEPGLVVGLLRPAFGGENTTFDQQLGRVGLRANIVFFFEGR